MSGTIASAATRSSPLSFRCACSVLPLCRASGHPQKALFSLSVPSLPYSSTRRKRPHWACRIFLKPRTGPGTRCDFGQNGQTKDACPEHWVSDPQSPPSRPCTALYSTGSRGTTTFTAGLPARAGLTATFAASLFTARFTGRALAPARVLYVYVLLAFFRSPQPTCQRQPGTAFAVLLTLGALVQDCAPSTS